MIDIDKLTEAELIDLNHRIVERLRFLDQLRSHVGMLDFKIGDRVSFQPPGQGHLEGILTRDNKKTVSVITDTGQRWNVSPALLSRTSKVNCPASSRRPSAQKRAGAYNSALSRTSTLHYENLMLVQAAQCSALIEISYLYGKN
jgi:hypothetical protein